MLIIVEGQDRCGKSTLIQNLVRYWNDRTVTVLHSGKPPKDVDQYKWSENYYKSNTEKFIEKSKSETIILDRFHIGEMVYGPIFRNYFPRFAYECDRSLGEADDVFLILLTDRPENIISRSDGQSLEQDDVCLLENVYFGFVDEFNLSTIKNKLHLDISNVGFENVLNRVTGFIDAKCSEHKRKTKTEISE